MARLTVRPELLEKARHLRAMLLAHASETTVLDDRTKRTLVDSAEMMKKLMEENHELKRRIERARLSLNGADDG